MNQENKLTKETFKAENFTFVDLGLPSGTQWATENAPGYYQYDEAVEVFGSSLPKAWKLVELWEECEWTWNRGKKGYDVVGPNGNSIFLPAAGYMDFDDRTGKLNGALAGVGGGVSYWSFAPGSQTYARCLLFNSTGVGPLNASYRAGGFSVRPSREL